MDIVGIVLVVAFLVALFMVCRELFCWYWKINHRFELQQEQMKVLQKQSDTLQQLLIEQYACKAQLEALLKRDQEG